MKQKSRKFCSQPDRDYPNLFGFIWKIRLKLYAEAGKLCAEAGKFYAEAGKLCGEAGKFYAEAGKLCAEAGKLYAEADKLCGEAGKLCAEGDIIWADAILSVHGNIKIEWKSSTQCRLETGEEFDEKV